MIVLVIGSGGREHAIVWKLLESPKVDKVFCAPGNAGIADLAECINIPQNDFNGLSQFVLENKISLTVVGPEVPLSEGIVDHFHEKGLVVFGPEKKAAEIESSKAFAKNFMKKYDIPTASFEVFDADEYNAILAYLRQIKYPIVIKADGLAAGKGVIIPEDFQSAEKTINEIIKDKAFGSAGEKIVIEEYMQGEETSLFAVTDGSDFVILSTAQDHKRIFDNDEGKNTGGMGAYSPAPVITPEIMDECINKIVKPTIEGMKKENRLFAGCLYCGLMITNDGPKVVEYNCRFGDPETQVVLPLIDSDFYDLLFASATGSLKEYQLKIKNKSAVCVILASKGYPDNYEKGKEIFGLINNDVKGEPEFIVFHSGTKKSDGKIVTSGGRVLGITALGEAQNLSLTINKAYEIVKTVKFDGVYYRTDIGKKGLKYKGLA